MRNLSAKRGIGSSGGLALGLRRGQAQTHKRLKKNGAYTLGFLGHFALCPFSIIQRPPS